MIAPLALTRRGLGYALASVGLGASWLVIGLRDIWYLVALLAALVTVSLLIAIMLARHARPEVRLSVTNPTPVVGASVSFTATVRHRLPVPIRAEMVWEVAGDRLSVPFTARAGEQAVTGVEWEPVRRGPGEARIMALRLSDSLGLAVCRTQGTASVPLLVLPRPLEAFAALLDADWSGDDPDGTWTRPRPGRSGAPSGTVRAYRSGDAMREVHWKQSARQGELLVNLREQTDHPERSLLLDTDPDAYRSISEFDLAVSATAALAEYWLRHGQTVRLHLGSGATVLCTSESELLRTLAFADPDETVEPPAGEWNGLPSAVVTGTVTERLADRLRRGTANGGTVYTLRAGGTGRVPEAWRLLVVPLPNPGDRAPPPGGRNR